MSDLIGSLKDRFPHDAAHIIGKLSGRSPNTSNILARLGKIQKMYLINFCVAKSVLVMM